MEKSVEEVDKLLDRIGRCELYKKHWGYEDLSPLTIRCRRSGIYKNHGISTCEDCTYLPEENEN